MPQAELSKSTSPVSLSELARLFLRIGATTFGGPAAHIAVMEDEIVRRKRWISAEEFMDMIAVTNMIPGPNSTEMAIHIGYRKAGFPGLLVAGISFITPAFLIVLVIAWVYVKFGTLPLSTALLYGIKPVIIAVVIQAVWRLGRSAIKSPLLAGLAATSAGAYLAGLGEIAVFALSGAIAFGGPGLFRKQGSRLHCLFPIGAVSFAAAGVQAAAAAAAFSLSKLFLVFLKIGSVLFGSGYVLLAFLKSDLVEQLGWLTDAQLLDAIAVGQVTPGPVFTTATFIGYLLSGPSGAAAATIGIFLPAFFFVAVTAPLLPRLRRSRAAAQVLDGLNAASLALMGVVAMQLASAAIVDWLTAALALISAAALLRWNISSTWLVLAGAAAGALSAALF